MRNQQAFTLWRQHVLTCDIIPNFAGFNIHSAHNVNVNTHSQAWQEEQHIIIGIVTEQLSLGTVGWASMVTTTASVSAPDWCTVTSDNTSVQDRQVCPHSLSPQFYRREKNAAYKRVLNFISVTIHVKLFLFFPPTNFWVIKYTPLKFTIKNVFVFSRSGVTLEVLSMQPSSCFKLFQIHDPCMKQTQSNAQFRINHMTLKVLAHRIWPSWLVEVSADVDLVIICAQCERTAAVFYDCLGSPATAAFFILRKPHMSQY